jgi:hypothetical protein
MSFRRRGGSTNQTSREVQKLGADGLLATAFSRSSLHGDGAGVAAEGGERDGAALAMP